MKRSALFIIALLLISGLAFGQAVVTPSGQATTGGALVPVAPVVSPPLVVTPSVHLSNAPTQPSMSGASALTVPQQPAAPSSRADISYGPPAAIIVPETTGTEAVTSAPSTTGTETAPAFTMGVNSAAAEGQSNGLNGRSLGEVARQLRQNTQNQNAKMYTNDDVEKLPTAGGITGGTTAGVSPQQFPPNGSYPMGNNGVIMENGRPLAGGQAVGTSQNPAANTSGVAQPATEQNEQPATNQPAQSGTMNALPPQPQQETAPPQKPSAVTPPPPQQMAQANVPPNPAQQNAAAPRSNARSEQPANNSQPQKLPKSASLLPLIALVGAGATVAGLMARKH